MNEKAEKLTIVKRIMGDYETDSTLLQFPKRRE